MFLPLEAQSIFRLLAVFTASFWTSAARCLSTSVILRGFGARMSSLLYPGTRMFQLRSDHEQRPNTSQPSFHASSQPPPPRVRAIPTATARRAPGGYVPEQENGHDQC